MVFSGSQLKFEHQCYVQVLVVLRESRELFKLPLERFGDTTQYIATS
jgi:hypothetical protein